LFLRSQKPGSEQRYFGLHLYLTIAPCFHHRHDYILCGHEWQLLPDPPLNHLEQNKQTKGKSIIEIMQTTVTPGEAFFSL